MGFSGSIVNKHRVLDPKLFVFLADFIIKSFGFVIKYSLSASNIF